MATATFTQEQRRAQFDKLSPELQEAILAVELIDTIKGIAQKHALMLDKVSILSDEISLTMLGLRSSKSFVQNISQRLEIPEDKARLIAQDIDAAVFTGIRKYLVESTVEVDDDIIPEHKHEEIRQETLAAIESHPSEQHISVNVLSKTQPIMAQQKPIEQGTLTTPVASATPAPVTPEVPTTTISQPIPATNPELVASAPITQATPVEPPKPAPKAPSYLVDPYREPIE